MPTAGVAVAVRVTVSGAAPDDFDEDKVMVGSPSGWSTVTAAETEMFWKSLWNTVSVAW